MNLTFRIKVLISYLKDNNFISSQKQLGQILGYKTESAFSQIINGKVPFPLTTFNKIEQLYPFVNINWLLTGEGKMLKTPPPSIPKDKVHTTLSTHDIDEQSKRELNPTIEELIDIITTNTKTIDRLTLIIETLSSKI